MDRVMVFKNEEFEQLRVVRYGNRLLFAAKDVVECLGYSSGAKVSVVGFLEAENKLSMKVPTTDGNKRMNLVDLAGLYSLIYHCTLPAARRFRRWVTNDVIPTVLGSETDVCESQLLTADQCHKALEALQAEQQKSKALRARVEFLSKKLNEMEEKDLSREKAEKAEKSGQPSDKDNGKHVSGADVTEEMVRVFLAKIRRSTEQDSDSD